MKELAEIKKILDALPTRHDLWRYTMISVLVATGMFVGGFAVAIWLDSRSLTPLSIFHHR